MPRSYVRFTSATFIATAKETHGDDKYDYTKTKFKSTKDKLTIICYEHGEFQQTSHEHVHRHRGCPRCALKLKVARLKSRSVTYSEFKERAAVLHKDAYNYPDDTNYVNTRTKIPIRCIKHNHTFQQSATAHLNGNGCPICCNEQKGKWKLSNTTKFIEQAQAKYGDYFDYSQVDYEHSEIHVTIICPEHGEFLQKPMDHFRLILGCPQHGHDDKGRRQRVAEEDFIERAIRKHDGKYTYDNLHWEKITRLDQKVQIECPKHGFFWQKPSMHMQGNGCPSCSIQYRSSAIALLWLEECASRDKTYIETAQNGGERRIMSYLVDGFSEELNKVYEFQGEQRVFDDYSLLT